MRIWRLWELAVHGSRVEMGRLLDWLADFPKGAAPHLVCNGGVGQGLERGRDRMPV